MGPGARFSVVMAAVAVLWCTGVPGLWAEPGKEAPVSSFVGELPRSYTATRPPAREAVLKWDFSQAQTHTYSYAQRGRIKTLMRGFTDTGGSPEQALEGKGRLVVASRGAGRANLVLEGFGMRRQADLPGREGDAMERMLPPLVIEGLEEDGRLPPGGLSREIMLRLLFPLPRGKIRVGETLETAEQMPLNIPGSPPTLTGRRKVKLTQYVRIDKRTCAQLDCSIEFWEPDLSSKGEDEWRCTATGDSVFYFDVVERRFVSGTLAFLLQVRMDLPARVSANGGCEAEKKGRARARSQMVSDTLVRVELME